MTIIRDGTERMSSAMTISNTIALLGGLGFFLFLHFKTIPAHLVLF